MQGGPKLTVTGDQNLTIQDDIAAAAQTIDAGAFTGKLNIEAVVTATAATTDIDQTITGGSGDDTPVF